MSACVRTQCNLLLFISISQLENDRWFSPIYGVHNLFFLSCAVHSAQKVHHLKCTLPLYVLLQCDFLYCDKISYSVVCIHVHPPKTGCESLSVCIFSRWFRIEHKSHTHTNHIITFLVSIFIIFSLISWFEHMLSTRIQSNWIPCHCWVGCASVH